MTITASKGVPEKRFNLYKLNGDFTKIDLIGLVNNSSDYELGTASMSRRENITFLASNSSKSSILANIKWRPNAKNGTATIFTRFELEFDGNCYEHEQVVTYEPSKSVFNYITQYGGQQSNVKFYVYAPYRRMRLTFQGYMRNKLEPAGSKRFVKLGFIISPTSGIIDLLNQCTAIDRHEQLVQIKGEYTVHDSENVQESRMKRKFYGWGFYIRNFLTKEKFQEVKTKRILAHFINGRAFHLAQTEDGLNTGYAFLTTEPVPKLAANHSVDWSRIDENTKEFEFGLSNDDPSLTSKAAARGHSSRLFDSELDGKKGWAWLLCDDANDSMAEHNAIKDSESQYSTDLEELKIAKSVRSSYGNSKPLIVELDKDECKSSDLVGSKAASLAQLRSFTRVYKDSNYHVPNAFVLTKYAYELILDNNPSLLDEISKLELIMAEGNQTKVRDACERLQSKVKELTVPQQLQEAIKNYLQNNYEQLDDCAFAVRSSSWGEDEEDMSAAGQLTTILGARGFDRIFSATMECFSSKFTLANIEYKRQHGMSAHLPMAVIIQEMVQCEKAGVMFTCDPTLGDDRVYTITANYGLGESVVNGSSEPDSIKVKVEGDSIEIDQIDIGAKKIIIDSETLDGNSESHQNYDRSKCCLNNEEILNLAECGRKIAHYYQGPRDIEWGIKDDKLYLLQSRPATGLDGWSEFELMHECDQPSRAELEFCTRANIGEVMPYAITPFTMSAIVNFWAVMGFKSFGDYVPEAEYCPECPQDLTYHSYHSFFNLRGSVIFAMSTTDKNKSIAAKSIEIGFFGREIEDSSEIVEASRGLGQPPNPFSTFKYFIDSLSLRFTPLTKIAKDRRAVANLRADVRALEYVPKTMSKMAGLFHQMIYVLGRSGQIWSDHISIIFLNNACNMELVGLLAKYIKDPMQVYSALAKFLATAPNVISAEIPMRILSISRLIKDKPQEEVDKFINMDTYEGLKYIQSDEKVCAEFDAFIERFGHRCYNEFESSVKSWRENPTSIIEMIQQNCKANTKCETAKLDTIDKVLDSLNFKNLSLKDKINFKYFVGRKIQTFVAARELTKDALVEHSDAIRLASRLLAKEMTKNLRIPDEDLLYYIFMDELQLLIQRPQPSIVVQAIRRRNMFKNCFKELWKFDEIISGYEFTPNHLKPSKELDEKLANAPKLYGTPASSGRVQGKVCLVDGYKELDKVRPGDILLTHSTDIAFSPVFPLISGIITEVGGLISHGAVVAREYGLPSVLGIPEVTRIIKDGEEIILDADNGTIIRLSSSSTQ